MTAYTRVVTYEVEEQAANGEWYTAHTGPTGKPWTSLAQAESKMAEAQERNPADLYRVVRRIVTTDVQVMKNGYVTVREVTHHGDYRHTRDVPMSASITEEEVERMLATCAYPYVNVEQTRFDRVVADLHAGQEAQHGWTRWQVVG